MIDFEEKIFVAGHRGMVGAAIMRRLLAQGYRHIVTGNRAQLDLTDQTQVREFFESQRIDKVYLAAARVGGIHANNASPVGTAADKGRLSYDRSAGAD
jgi:GDP-L-fucose synthase